MDFRANTQLPTPRRPSAAARAPDGAPGAPPRGQGRRLPVRRADEREPRRTSRRRRRSIAEVAAVIDAPRPSPARDPSRWARFEAMVLEAGVSRERLLDAFPDVDDIEDVFHTPDEDLPACAATLVRSLLGSRVIAAGPAADGPSAAPVRCVDCRRFVRSATHPRLGRCGAGRPPSAAGGLWDTQRRDCPSFAASAGDPVVGSGRQT